MEGLTQQVIDPQANPFTVNIGIQGGRQREKFEDCLHLLGLILFGSNFVHKNEG